MKQLWTEDAEMIRQEMDLIVQEKIRLFCIRRSVQNMKKLIAHGITQTEAGPLLILDHPHEPTCSQSTCNYYYHRKGQPLRCFECVKGKRVETYLGMTFPTRIFDIQRRRHPRVDTPDTSSATFSFQNKQRVHYGKVLNVSLAGARLAGDIPTIVKKGEIITPLVLTLHQQLYVGEETRIHIPEATIKRVLADDERTMELGVHFSLPTDEHQTMADYIEMRNIEETIKTKKNGLSS